MTDLVPLEIVAQAQYDHRRQKFARIVQEETALRTEINRIDSLDQTPGQPDSRIGEMRAIGADLLWQGWLNRSKVSLNMKLAQVLARKAHEQDHVKEAFGKLTALRSLIKANAMEQRRKQTKAELSAAMDQALLNQFRG